MNLPLFDLQQKPQMHQGAGPEDAGRPVDAGDAHSRSRASSDHAVIPPPQGVSGERQSIGATAADGVRRARGSEILHPDVLRIIEAKAGPFVLLYDGKPSGRYYQIVETGSGEFLHRDCDESGRCDTDRNDWSPVPADSTRRLVEDGLRNGTMRVVEAEGW